jgi:hypothetical protein
MATSKRTRPAPLDMRAFSESNTNMPADDPSGTVSRTVSTTISDAITWFSAGFRQDPSISHPFATALAFGSQEQPQASNFPKFKRPSI